MRLSPGGREAGWGSSSPSAACSGRAATSRSACSTSCRSRTSAFSPTSCSTRRWRRSAPVFPSALHDGSAELAGRLADGLWTLGDPRQAPGAIAAYRRGAEEAGREPGEIVLQTLASWASSDEEALAGAREWKGTLVDEHYVEPIADPAEIGRSGSEVSDSTFESLAIVSADPDEHVRKLLMLERMGATTVSVMNVSGADPAGTLRVYGEQVLPALRG